jgi:hypothetical protein
MNKQIKQEATTLAAFVTFEATPRCAMGIVTMLDDDSWFMRISAREVLDILLRASELSSDGFSFNELLCRPGRANRVTLLPVGRTPNPKRSCSKKVNAASMNVLVDDDRRPHEFPWRSILLLIRPRKCALLLFL